MILAHSRPWEDQRGWCDSSWSEEEANHPPLPTLTQPCVWESGRTQLPSVCLHFLWGGQARSKSGKLRLLSSRQYGSLWGWPKSQSLLVTATHVVFSREDRSIFINWERRCLHETSFIWNTRARQKRWAVHKEMSEGSGDRLPGFNLGPSTYHYVKLEQILWFLCLSSPNQQNENNNHSIQVTGLSWQLIHVKFFNTVWHMVMPQ